MHSGPRAHQGKTACRRDNRLRWRARICWRARDLARIRTRANTPVPAGAWRARANKHDVRCTGLRDKASPQEEMSYLIYLLTARMTYTSLHIPENPLHYCGLLRPHRDSARHLARLAHCRTCARCRHLFCFACRAVNTAMKAHLQAAHRRIEGKSRTLRPFTAAMRPHAAGVCTPAPARHCGAPPSLRLGRLKYQRLCCAHMRRYRGAAQSILRASTK